MICGNPDLSGVWNETHTLLHFLSTNQHYYHDACVDVAAVSHFGVEPPIRQVSNARGSPSLRHPSNTTTLPLSAAQSSEISTLTEFDSEDDAIRSIACYALLCS